MTLFGKKESDAGAGSGDGGTTGTPGTDTKMEPAGGAQEGAVVSGGGLADPSADDGGPTSGE